MSAMPWRMQGRSGCSCRKGQDKETAKAAIINSLFILILSVHLSAQESEPRPLRFDVTPFIGYRTSMSFPVEPHVTGTNPHVVVDASPSYGLSFGVRLRDEDDVVEMRWARQDSYVYSKDISPQAIRQRLIIDQFHGDFSHEGIVEGLPRWAKPFAVASIGATRVRSNTPINFTRFSFGIGGGVRLYPSRHVGFKVQAQWLPLLIEPYGVVLCGAGCIVHVGGTLSSQGEVFAGPILRF